MALRLLPLVVPRTRVCHPAESFDAPECTELKSPWLYAPNIHDREILSLVFKDLSNPTSSSVRTCNSMVKLLRTTALSITELCYVIRRIHTQRVTSRHILRSSRFLPMSRCQRTQAKRTSICLPTCPLTCLAFGGSDCCAPVVGLLGWRCT